jgi:hypothetical protein
MRRFKVDRSGSNKTFPAVLDNFRKPSLRRPICHQFNALHANQRWLKQ